MTEVLTACRKLGTGKSIGHDKLPAEFITKTSHRTHIGPHMEWWQFLGGTCCDRLHGVPVVERVAVP